MKKVFVGVGGPIGGGKSTFTKALHVALREALEIEASVIAFARPLKELAAGLFVAQSANWGETTHILFGPSSARAGLMRQRIDQDFSCAHKVSVALETLGVKMTGGEVVGILKEWMTTLPEVVTGRRVLQELGTEIGRNKFHINIWTRMHELEVQASSADVIISDDARFPNEFAGMDFLARVKSDEQRRPEDLSVLHESERHIWGIEFMSAYPRVSLLSYGRNDRSMLEMRVDATTLACQIANLVIHRRLVNAS